jgi:hypothetical protein
MCFAAFMVPPVELFLCVPKTAEKPATPAFASVTASLDTVSLNSRHSTTGRVLSSEILLNFGLNSARS